MAVSTQRRIEKSHDTFMTDCILLLHIIDNAAFFFKHNQATSSLVTGSCIKSAQRTQIPAKLSLSNINL